MSQESRSKSTSMPIGPTKVSTSRYHESKKRERNASDCLKLYCVVINAGLIILNIT